MSDEQTTSSQPLTDEALAEAFPGQDLDHIKSMMGKMDGQSGEADATSTDDPSSTETEDESETVEYPEWIPEKYRNGTVEDAMKATAEGYKALESKLGKPDGTTSDTGSTSEDESGDEGDDNSVSMRDVEQEFLEDGKVSKATYDAMEAKGISKDVIDGYLAGQQAIANQRVTKVHEAVGGEEKYGDMLKWASENWTSEEITAFDNTMKGVDDAAIMLAVRGLKAVYNEANPADPNLVTGESGKVAAGGSFESSAQMTEAMRDPRYATDPAYRKEVEQKLARSTFW